MKAYTDLPQSKKLAEILSHITADNTWERVTIAGSNLNVPEEQQYVHNGNMPFCFYSGIGIPCWSLAALLDVLPNCIEGAEPSLIKTFRNDYRIVYDIYGDENITSEDHTNPIDACYEMLIRFHEQKLL